MSKTQLARLIDLPDDALQQVLDYAQTLSKAEAIDHLKNLLGDSPAAVTFIADFNGRRHDPAGPSVAATAAAAVSPTPAGPSDAVPRSKGRKKKKPALHTPAPRQVTQAPPPGAAYNKKDVQEEYISGRSSTSTPVPSSSSTPPPRAKPQPAAGSLIQDALQPKAKPKPAVAKQTAKPVGKPTKVTITGGTAMHGASTALADLDSAIRALEVSTNPKLSGSDAESPEERAARRCNCVATRHPLQNAAPNCLGCGKVICVKEGLGPCTFCGRALLSSGEVQAMIRELREERGREKMQADREANHRGGGGGGGGGSSSGGGKTARPTMVAGTVKWGGDDDFVTLAEAKARAHRDRLLGYQAQNAQRTTVRDEAADFDVSEAVAAAAGTTTGRNLWATPEERARELRRQQKILREMEWNVRPEYEKRQQVISIDLTGRKVFRKTVAIERPREESEDEEDADAGAALPISTHAGGTFSKNPLLGGLIKPVFTPAEGQDKGKDREVEREKRAANSWRRVQDDLDDNEAVILDGGITGGEEADEPGR